MSPENQIQDRYDAHDKAMNEPTYTPHIGQPYEVAPTPLFDAFDKGSFEHRIDELEKLRDFARSLERKLAEVTAERDKMLRRIGANETAQLLTQAVQKQCEETLYWKGVVRGARAELHQAGRISDEEYAALCEDTAARDHMDTMDEVKAQRDAEHEARKAMQIALQAQMAFLDTPLNPDALPDPSPVVALIRPALALAAKLPA